MAKNKRSKFQRECDLAEFASLYLQGKTQYEIAVWVSANRRYTLSIQQIGKDLRAVRERWQQSSIRDMDERKAEELARIDNLEATHWAAWEESFADRPDPRHLEGVLKCIQTRAKILGIEAPQRVGIGQDPDAGPLEINATDELLSRIAGIATRIGANACDREPDA